MWWFLNSYLPRWGRLAGVKIQIQVLHLFVSFRLHHRAAPTIRSHGRNKLHVLYKPGKVALIDARGKLRRCHSEADIFLIQSSVVTITKISLLRLQEIWLWFTKKLVLSQSVSCQQKTVLNTNFRESTHRYRWFVNWNTEWIKKKERTVIANKQIHVYFSQQKSQYV